MLDQYLQALRQGDQAKRKTAIHAIVRSGDARSQAVLEQHLQTERDPDLRTYTQKGIQYLQKHTTSTHDAVSTPAPTMSSVTPPALPTVPTNVIVPPSDNYVTPERRERAQSFLKIALTAYFAGNHEEALRDLQKALQLDPNLANEQTVMNIAATRFGLSSKQAVEKLKNDYHFDAKSARKGQDLLTQLLELLIVVVVVCIVYTMSGTITAAKSKEGLAVLRDLVRQTSTIDPVSAAAADAELRAALNTTQDQIIRDSLWTAIRWIVITILSGSIVWSAGNSLGGTGTWKTFQTANLLCSVALAIIFSLLFNLINFKSIGQALLDRQLDQVWAQIAPFLIGAAVLFMVLNIIWTWIIARVHHLSLRKGLVMQTMGVVVMFLLSLGFELLTGVPMR